MQLWSADTSSLMISAIQTRSRSGPHRTLPQSPLTSEVPQDKYEFSAIYELLGFEVPEWIYDDEIDKNMVTEALRITLSL